MIQEPYRPRGRIAKWCFIGTWVVLIANFLAMIVHDAIIGGTALLRGHISDGPYYVCTKIHCVEVSQATYEGSRLHGILFFAVSIVGMLFIFFIVLDDHTRSP